MTETASPAVARSVSAGIAWARGRAADLTRDLVAAHGEAVDIAAPWTGEQLHTLTLATVQDVDAAETAARAAQASPWAMIQLAM